MALVGIVMLPFYVSALGVEAYGMVGLFVALQGWLTLLDLGLSPTLARESARFRAGAAEAVALRGLLRFVLLLFVAIGVLLFAVLGLGADAIVHHWLHNRTLSDHDAAAALRLIGAALALRFLCIPLRSFLTGAEDLVWLGLFNGSITSVKSVLVLGAMAVLGPSLEVFFVWQLVASAAEVAMLALRVRHFVPAANDGERGGLSALHGYWQFSLGMGVNAALWGLTVNADKILLSGILALRDYSIFSVATVAAGGIQLVAAPFALALTPRITRLYAERRRDDMVHLYNQATQLISVTALPAALVLALFPTQVLWGWTGNAEIARVGTSVLTLYALGNALLAINGLPFQLQVAAGRMKLQVLATSLFLVLFVPAMWWGAKRWGMAGAGAAWLSINLLSVVLWVPFAHRRFLPASHLGWLVRQLFSVLLPTAAVALLLRVLLPWPDERLLVIVQLLAIGGVLVAVAVASAGTLRGHVAATARGLLLSVR